MDQILTEYYHSVKETNWTPVLVILLCTIVFLRTRKTSAAKLPPGPKGWPIIGNLLQRPQKEEWKVYEQWARQYGDITYLTFLGTPMIILNSLKTARDLMDGKLGNYSNRHVTAMDAWCDIEWLITVSNGELHRTRRALVVRYFSGPAALKHRSHQRKEAHVLLSNLLSKPDLLTDHIKQHAASSVLLGTYGYRVSGAHDDLVKEMDKALEYLEHGDELAGLAAPLLETFPSLRYYPRWLPFSSFRDYADTVKRDFVDIRVNPFARAKKMIENGTAAPSFVSTSLDDINESSPSPSEAYAREELLKDCAATLYGGGTETSVASMGAFFALMALHPTVLERAQKEIDAATGGERLPTFEDKDQLPYFEAIFLEVLRFNSVTPLGLPHKAVHDDVYNGFLIPGGSIIAANVWLMSNDPDTFTEPDRFIPERFLGEEGKRCREVLNIAWGFGRRTCPGRQFAEASLFITMTSIIACFDIAPKVDDTRKLPELTFSSGFIRKPLMFPLRIMPRSQRVRELIESESLAEA